jgi:hypothetical protein
VAVRVCGRGAFGEIALPRKCLGEVGFHTVTDTRKTSARPLGDNSSGRKTSFWRDSTADLASLNLKGPEKVLWLSLLDEKVSRQTGKRLNTQKP